MTSNDIKERGSEPPPTRERGQGRASIAPPGSLPDGYTSYLEFFSRPPLGDHPMKDGYSVGKALAERYGGQMQRVMQGFREGVKAGKTSSAGGDASC